MSKLLGMAVGAALENRDALQHVAVPAKNVAGGVGKVIWGTWWKSTVVGFGLLVVWFASFAFTYILGGTVALGDPTLMALFGVVLFVVMPAIVLLREVKRVGKTVTAKNDAHRKFVEFERNAQAEQNAKAISDWQAQQAQQGVLAPR
jgi:hypothetical protein